MTGHTSMMPVHQSALESSDKPWSESKQFVGNGAFVLDEWVVNERIELKKNRNTGIVQIPTCSGDLYSI
ncbi:hypothetical protein OK016_29880 [Vibrio chagasii]|nr:hypothetical protein [Vibrio chagasii]